MKWRIHHREVTTSTNTDAANGSPGDVFTADHQSEGRGRLDHKWHSRAGENLMMSAVVDVAGIAMERAATLPVAVGLAVAEAVSGVLPEDRLARLKWPNDVLVEGRKLSGILCERHDDRVVIGVGVNVLQESFPEVISDRATSLRLEHSTLPSAGAVEMLRDVMLASIASVYGEWREGGLEALMPRIRAIDLLRGREITVRQFDDDPSPISGYCGGIDADGSLEVNGRRVYAGEAHVLS